VKDDNAIEETQEPRLVNLHMPLLVVLQSLNPLLIINSLGFANLRQHILNTRHHSLQTAEVHVRTILQLVEDFIGILLNLVLDVHFATLLVVLLTGEGVVKTEVVGETSLGILEFIIVEEGVGVGNTEEEPGLALVDTGGGSVLEEETTDESTEGGDSGTGGHHDVVGGGILLGHEHNLTGRSGHGNFGTGGGVAKEVGANTLLSRILSLEFGAPVGGTTNAKTASLSGHIITITGGGDGVKTDGMGLAILLTNTGWDNTPGLSLNVGKISIVIDDDVASLTGGLGSNDALGGDDLSGEGCLVFVGVDLEVGDIVVGGELKEILLQVEGGSDDLLCQLNDE
jgi:hypothetical protein